MHGFNIKAKSLEELGTKIDIGTLDDMIKKCLFNRIREEGGKLEFDSAAEFELTAEIEEAYTNIYLYKYASDNNKLTKQEKALLEKFVDRIDKIYKSISEEDIKRKLGGLLNSKRIFLDVEKLGMPKIFLNTLGVTIFAEAESIKEDEHDVVISTGKFQLRITHLVDSLMVDPGGRPANLIIKCKQCYDVLTSDMEYTGFNIYWPDEKE